MYLVQKYLAMFYQAELVNIATKDENPFKKLQEQKGPEWNALSNIFVPKMIEWNVSFSILKKMFHEKFRLFYSFEARLGVLIGTNTYDSSQISYISEAEVCYVIGLSNAEHNTSNLNSSNPVIVQMNTQSRAPLPGQLVYPFANQDDPFAIDLNGRTIRPAAESSSYDVSVLTFGKAQRVIANVAADYYSLPIVESKLKCSQTTNFEECRLNCRREQLKKLCHCSPVALPTLSSDNYAILDVQKAVPECTFRHYESCLDTFNGQENISCTKNCLQSCYRRKFTFRVMDFDRAEAGITRYQSQLSIFIEIFDYAKFEEEFFWTVKDVIGEFGGIVGLCLGVDFIILIDFVFSPCMQLVELLLIKICSKSQHKNQVESDSNISSSSVTSENEKSKSYLITKFKAIIQKLKIKGPPFYSAKFVMKWLMEKIFWLIVYSAGTVITARLLLELYRDYDANKTDSRVKIMFNKSLTLSPMTICISVHMMEYDHCNFYANCSKRIYSKALTDYLKYDGATKEKFLDTEGEKRWPIPLTYLTLILFGTIQVTESNINSWPYNLTSNLRMNGWFKEEYGDNPSINEDHFHAITEILVPLMESWNISWDELRQKTGYEFSQMHSLKLRFVSKNTSRIIEYIPLTAAITDIASTRSLICYQLPIEQPTFFDAADVLQIAADLSAVPYPDDYYYHKISLFLKDPSFLGVPEFTPNGLPPDAEWNFEESGRIYFGIATQFKSMPSVGRGPQRCSDGESVQVCQARCRIDFLEKLLNCSPTSWPWLLSQESQQCSFQQLMDGLNFKGTDDEACRTSCLNSCNRTSYVSERVIEASPFPSATLMQISIGDFTYPVFEEKYVWTTEKLLSDLGNILGFCMGADMSSLIWIVFMPTMIVLELCLDKEKKETTVRPIQEGEKRQILSRYRFLSIVADKFFDRDTMANWTKLHFAKWIFDKGFQAFVYITGTVFTIIWCFNLYSQYLGSTTITIVKVNTDQYIDLRNATLCIPLNFRSTTIDDSNQDEDVEQFLKQIRVDKLQPEDAVWSSTMLDAVYRYLLFVGGNFELQTEESVGTAETPGCLASNAQTSTDWSNLIQLGTKMEQMNVSFEKLMHVFGRELRRLFPVIVKGYFLSKGAANKSLSVVDLSPTSTTFIDESTICYQLPLALYTFTDYEEYLHIEIEKPEYPITNMTSKIDISNKITLDFRGRKGNQGKELNSMIIINFGENVNATVEIDAIYRSLPEFTNCSESTTTDECKWKCHYVRLQEHFNCTPSALLSDRTAAPALDQKVCSWSDYEKCPTNFDNEIAGCIKSCQNSCTQVRYQLAKESQSYSLIEGESPLNQAQIRLSIRTFDYTIFEDQYEWKFEKFIGAFGGMLGLFVGLDFFIVIRFVIKSLAELVDICLKMKHAQVILV